jgi:hypothetical protein
MATVSTIRSEALDLVNSLHQPVMHLERLLTEARDRVTAVEQLVVIAKLDWSDDQTATTRLLSEAGVDVTPLETAFENWAGRLKEMDAESELRYAAAAAVELEQALQDLRDELRVDG